MRMGERRSSTRSLDAGVVTASLQSSSQDRGLSVVPDAKQTTGVVDALDELLLAPARKPGPKCAVYKILHELPEDQSEKLRYLIDESPRSAGAIAEALAKMGHPISLYTVQRHRNRRRGDGCRCP